MWTERVGRSFIQPSEMPGNAIGEFHTHPNLGGNWVEMHSPADLKIKVPSYVIGRNNVWYKTPYSRLLPNILYRSSIFNPYPYYPYWLDFLNLNK